MKSGSRLEKVLEAGHFAVTGELGPPKSADAEVITKKINLLKGFVDAVNITDNQTAIVRVSSIAAAKLCVDSGLEPIMQMTCRDRNRIAIQADILGAYILGIKNCLCLTGDHQTFGNHPGSRNVFDIDSIQLVNILKDMRDNKIFQCGEEIRNTKKSDVVEPRMYIGAAANPFGDPFSFRVMRLGKKVAAGADFIQTQCIFDIERFRKWMEGVRNKGLHEKVHILAGVMPVKSERALMYMQKNVAGMTIPDNLIERIGSKPKEEKKAEGIKVCNELLEQVRETEGVRGVHIMAVEWESVVPEIVKTAGLENRPDVS